MKKRILSFVLALTMIMSMAVVGISAATESTAVDGEHMALEKTVFEYGENIMVTTKNVGSDTDWVGIYTVDDVLGDNGSSQWFYAHHATDKPFNLSMGNGPLGFQPLPAGEYILYYLYNDGYEIGQSINITVKEQVIVHGGLISEVNNTIKTAAPLDVTPRTFDALVKLPTSYADRAGVIIGNYTDGATSAISFEIQAGGVPRLYYQEGSTTWNHLFNEVDMRSKDAPVRLTLVQDPAAKTITCYINGEAKQTLNWADGLPEEIIPTQEQMIGGDFRGGNAQFFKGTIYKAAIYSDALTADQIAAGEGTGLIASYDFTRGKDSAPVDLSGNGYDLVGNMNIIEPPMTGLVSQVNNTIKTAAPLDVTPRTFDALVKLPTSYADRAGVIIGNYTDGATSAISFEIQPNGVPRLYYQEESATWNHLFNEVDMRSDEEPVRLTLVQDPAAKTITCYINGEAKQTLNWADGLPEEIIPTQEQMIGGDFRGGNAQFFKGTIYKAAIYSDALTADQIAAGEGTGLIASYDFTAAADQHIDLSGNGYDLVGDLTIFDPYSIAEEAPEFEEGLTFESAMQYQTGEDGYADVPYTYSAWVYLPKTHTDRAGVIIGNYQSGSIPCVSIEIAAGGVPRFYHINLDGSVTDLRYLADIRTNDWVHLAFTVTDVVTCYVNGESVGEQPLPEFESLATEMTIGIGGDLRAGNAQYFKGRIKEIALFEDPLSPTDIRTLYKSGVSAVDEDLVAHYDMTAAEYAKDIADLSGNNYTAFADPRFFTDKEPVGEYAYSFAFIGDTQNLNEKFPDDFNKIYDWLAANKDEKKIQHVFGLGDITNSDTDKEWKTALDGISKLDGVIPYSLVRGNHDSTAQFTKTFGTDVYKNQFEGFYNDTLANSWRTFKAGSVDYLFITLDYGANDDVLNWASDVIASHPDHKVIITTHCYLFHDGTTLDEGDICPPSNSGGTNNGDHMWDKLISKHANIVLVVSGHDPWDTIVKKQTKGDNGNTVTQVLIDPQTVELGGPLGMVAMFYFSEDGSEIEVEYYSTVREKFFMLENQFKMTIPPMEVKPAETEPAETAAPETEAAETDAPAAGTPSETSAPAETDAPAVSAPKESGNTGIIIGVIAAVVVIGGAAGIIIAKKKKG